MTGNFIRGLIIPFLFLPVNTVSGQRIMEKPDGGAFAAVAGNRWVPCFNQKIINYVHRITSRT